MQEEQRELAKTIRVSGSILLSTVSNFLDFFKMEAGKQLDVVRTEMTTKVDWLWQMANLLYLGIAEPDCTCTSPVLQFVVSILTAWCLSTAI